MSAETVGAHMPAVMTLDDLAAMAGADEHGHRYELSPEGVLSIMPPAGVEPAIIASRLFGWFLAHGWPVDQVLQNRGLRTGTVESPGGRVPDLTVWSAVPAVGQVWAPLDGLQLAVEIVSRGSEVVDLVVKRAEYAAAGIPRYWLVNRDTGNTVTMWRLAADKDTYQAVSQSSRPLAWVLNTDPADYLTR